MPRRSDGTISWARSVGCHINFVYENIIGEFEIIATNEKRDKCKIKYNGSIFEIQQRAIKNGNFGVITGKHSAHYQNYWYNADDIVKTNTGEIKILSQCRLGKKNNRGYQYKCMRCGYEGQIKENEMRTRGYGCPVCGRTTLVPGVNDVATLRPDISKWFADKEETKKVTPLSHKKEIFVCPDCGASSKHEVQIVARCNYVPCACRGNISFPEKFAMSIFLQKGINFEHQYSPKWLGRQRYDFYLTDFQTAVEMDGGFHNPNSNHLLSEEEKDKIARRDKRKNVLAMKNDLKLIRINCEESNADFIIGSMRESGLLDIIGQISENQKIEAIKFAQKNIVKEVCEYYNAHKPIASEEIGTQFHLKKYTVNSYLQIGDKVGWCKRTNVLADLAEKRLIDICEYYNQNKSTSAEQIKDALGLSCHIVTVRSDLRKGANLGLCDYEYKNRTDKSQANKENTYLGNMI